MAAASADRKLSLPHDGHRITIVGATGSGKTQAGVWHLSRASFDRRPWIVIDFKRDQLLARLRAEPISLSSRPPRRAGLYILRPLPGQLEEVDDFLWKVHANERTGIFVDEGYMMPKFPPFSGFRTILTQGRSKKIPVITLSQRPVWLDRFAFTESNFWQIFRLQSDEDRKTVESFVNNEGQKKGWIARRLPEFHSHWYDVGNDNLRLWRPVPREDDLVASYRARLGRTIYV